MPNLKKWAPYSFTAGMLGVFLLAAGAPAWGSPHSPLPVHFLKRAGIFLIFFNQGVVLQREAVRSGFSQWKLHLLVQAAVFIWAPFLTGILLWLAHPVFDQADLRFGFLFLSFLPTTVSSAIVFTTLCRGNVSGAIFNCTLSTLLGVFITPFYCLSFLSIGQGADITVFLQMLANIAVGLLLPLILGQLLRKNLAPVYAQHRKSVQRFNNGVILFIVWTAFCMSFTEQIWRRITALDLGICLGGVWLLLVLTHAVIWKCSGWLKLDAASRLTALFCGSQKSLTVGLPLASILFGEVNAVNMSLLVIPLLIFHPMQLVFAGIIAPKLAVTNPPQR